jgi:peptidoglycan/LPS O-acetylase OafA/YrhL
MVFLHHSFAYLVPSWESGGLVITNLRIAVLQSAQLGVSFFFVLSGFLITFLILAEISRTGRVDVIAFYIRRLLRIWPLYYAVLFYAFVVHPAVERYLGMAPLPNPNWLRYVLFLGNLDVVDPKPFHTAITNITWSVAVEEQYYLVWPLIFRVVPRRFYIAVFLAIIAFSATYRAMHAAPFQTFYQYFHTFSVISDMAVGSMSAYLAWRSPRLKRFFEARSRLQVVAFYAVAGVVLALNRYLFVGKAAAAGRLLMAIAFAIIILEQNYATRSILKVSRLRFASTMGKYTYGLYLLHPIALWWIELLCSRANIRMDVAPSGFAVPALGFAAAVLIALASYYGFERHFLRIKERFAHVKNARC